MHGFNVCRPHYAIPLQMTCSIPNLRRICIATKLLEAVPVLHEVVLILLRVLGYILRSAQRSSRPSRALTSRALPYGGGQKGRTARFCGQGGHICPDGKYLI